MAAASPVLSPPLAAVLTGHVDGRLAAARHAFSTPERIPLTAEERAALAGHAQTPLRHEGVKLARWTLGQGPRVVLVHGWNSRGAHLLGLARALVEAGFSATLFDLPGHGDSTGHAASVVHAGRALRTLIAAIGIEVHAVGGRAHRMADNGMHLDADRGDQRAQRASCRAIVADTHGQGTGARA